MKQNGGHFGKSIWNGLCLALLFTLLPGPSAQAKNKGPHDEAEAIQWAHEALKATGSCDAPRVDSQFIVCGNSFGIALARVVSLGSNFDTASGYPHFYVTWQDYAHDQRESIAWMSAVITFSKAARISRSASKLPWSF